VAVPFLSPTTISKETLILLYGNQKLIITFVGKEEKGI
jgi:hypothetical protein